MYLLQVSTDNMYVRKKKSGSKTNKKLAGDEVIEAVTTPKRGRNRAKIIAQ